MRGGGPGEASAGAAARLLLLLAALPLGVRRVSRLLRNLRALDEAP